ncbi:cold-shock protein [Candidatus Nomurabacteria bacterium]|nr:cold-shock protein [Candidatus Nomurabacteria bacterium]
MAAEKKVSKSGEGHRSLKDGSTVSFDRGQGPKGEQAVNVKSA